MNDEEILRRIKIKAEELNELLKLSQSGGLFTKILICNQEIGSANSYAYRVHVSGERRYNIN